MLKTGLLFGSFFAFLTIVLGAFGAHALKEQLNEYGKSVYEKAVLYQMFHSLGILFVTLLNHHLDNLDLTVSIWCFCIGILLISGSLYILAITQIKWLGAITPIGGLFFIIGWALMFYKVMNSNL